MLKSEQEYWVSELLISSKSKPQRVNRLFLFSAFYMTSPCAMNSVFDLLDFAIRKSTCWTWHCIPGRPVIAMNRMDLWIWSLRRGPFQWPRCTRLVQIPPPLPNPNSYVLYCCFTSTISCSWLFDYCCRLAVYVILSSVYLIYLCD